VIYRVVIAHEAEKILDRLDRPTEQRIRTRIIQLAEDFAVLLLELRRGQAAEGLDLFLDFSLGSHGVNQH
jgi:mRNA-degrading endonuclease RelE of RelBE toxin-antitoxin system